ncbi:MAG: class I SAM-dependent methyltransferase [Nanoarchaeota archaeon]
MSWQEWYTRYAKYYHILDGASVDYFQFAKKLDMIFKKHKIKKILDFACGIGNLSIELKKLGYDVIGVDLNKAMINEALLNSKKEKVSFEIIERDLRKDFIGKFDAIICTYNYVGHFSKEEFIKIIDNFKRNLNKGGLIFFDIFNFRFMDKKFKDDLFIDASRTINEISATRFNQNKLDKKNKVMKINQITFIEDRTLKMYNDSWDLKIYTLEEINKILEDNFEIIEIYGSIFGDSMLCPYSDDKECIVILGKLKN